MTEHPGEEVLKPSGLLDDKLFQAAILAHNYLRCAQSLLPNNDIGLPSPEDIMEDLAEAIDNTRAHPSEEVTEAIARIIDPDAWRIANEGGGAGLERALEYSLERARAAIIAMRAAHTPDPSTAEKLKLAKDALEQVGSKAKLGGDCLGNSGPKFEPTQRAFYLLADLCHSAIAKIGSEG